MIRSRQELTDYCLRKLGYPVIEVNIQQDQLEDRIDDAIQWFQEYLDDGSIRTYIAAKIEASTLALASPIANDFIRNEKLTGQTSGATATLYRVKDDSTLELRKTEGTFVDGEVIEGDQSLVSVALAATNAFTLKNWDKKYFDVPDNIMEIVRVFNIGPASGGTNPRNLFDVVNQFRLNDMYNLLTSDFIYYTQVKQHLSLLDMLLPSDRTIRFSRSIGRLYMDVDWNTLFLPDSYIVAEAHMYIDPEAFPKAYNNIFLKRYATALIKKQWAQNLSKFTNISLPGGVTMNGAELYKQAIAEIEEVERDQLDQDRAFFFIG